MKKKFAISNLALMAFVLITIAWQSIHAFSHQHFSEQHLHSHHLEVNKPAKQLTASFENQEDNCSICDFHFDFFLAPQQFSYRVYFPFKPIPYKFNTIASSSYFPGSLFALRAPPVLV